MHSDNNDWERNYDYRGNEKTLQEGRPASANGIPHPFSNPAYNMGSHDEFVAEGAPNAYVELANLQNRHDDDEKAATLDRIEEIGKPGLNPLKHRELGKLADRMSVIDPNDDMAESHKRFKDANIDALIVNARAQAAQEGVAIDSNDNDK